MLLIDPLGSERHMPCTDGMLLALLPSSVYHCPSFDDSGPHKHGPGARATWQPGGCGPASAAAGTCTCTRGEARRVAVRGAGCAKDWLCMIEANELGMLTTLRLLTDVFLTTCQCRKMNMSTPASTTFACITRTYANDVFESRSMSLYWGSRPASR